MKKMNSILIADDEPDLRKYITHILTENPAHNLDITEATNGLEAVEANKKKAFDLIFLDVKMPEMDGLEALKEIMAYDSKAFVVMVTAHSNVRDAVIAIKDGAYDYLEKPLDKDQVLKIFNRAMEAKSLVKQIALSSPVMESDVDSEIIGQSSSMQSVFDLIKRISNLDSTILLRGENGTGKDLVAKAIHFNSNRKDESFIALNCAAIPDDLVESELFGHEKGAFTGATERKIGQFQAANNGTLFLDEIGDLKMEVQAKLLRALQDKTFTPVGSTRLQKTNARIITATHKNLEKAIIEKEFREDLYFRLNVMPIFIPPLKERKEDIPYLIEHFIDKYNNNSEKRIALGSEALQLLKNYNWPGNIRELENIIQRALIFTNGNEITKEALPEEILRAKDSGDADGLDFEKFKSESEKSFIVKALKANNGKINRTVANANIPKNTLLRKIKKFGIDVKSLADED